MNYPSLSSGPDIRFIYQRLADATQTIIDPQRLTSLYKEMDNILRFLTKDYPGIEFRSPDSKYNTQIVYPYIISWKTAKHNKPHVRGGNSSYLEIYINRILEDEIEMYAEINGYGKHVKVHHNLLFNWLQLVIDEIFLVNI